MEWLGDGYRSAWARLWGARSWGIARRLWQYNPLLTAPQGVALGKLWKYAMRSSGKGKEEVFSVFLLQ